MDNKQWHWQQYGTAWKCVTQTMDVSIKMVVHGLWQGAKKIRAMNKEKGRHSMPHNERCESPIISGVTTKKEAAML